MELGRYQADPGVGDQAWANVLEAMDRTYAELVDYQEELEARNAELTNLRHFLASIMTSISDFLIVADKNGRIADASASFCRLLGLDVGDLEKWQLSDFFEADDRDSIMDVVSRVISMRQEQTISVDLKTPEGRDPVEFRISPQLDRRRKCTGVVLTGRPMGELLRAYAKLETSHKELKEAQGQLVRNEKMASLGRLLAGVAHELNNPISFVYANTHTLEKYIDRFETYFEKVQSGASREELIELRKALRLERNLKNLRGAVRGAHEGAERVRDIVEDLRKLSAEGSGEMTRFDLAETARLSAHWIERGNKSETRITFSGEETCFVVGRPGHIQQVLMNLFQNAVDAMDGMESPSISIHLSYDIDWVTMDVCDCGPGIPPGDEGRIFDPFFSTKEVGKGTGLGLAISHKIIEEHGGRLELVRQQILGARFRITLPRGDSQ